MIRKEILHQENGQNSNIIIKFSTIMEQANHDNNGGQNHTHYIMDGTLIGTEPILCQLCVDDGDEDNVVEHIPTISDVHMQTSGEDDNIICDIEFCGNCKRQDNGGYFKIELSHHERRKIKQRKKIRYVSCSRTSLDMITLCTECAHYLTDDDGVAYKNMWPSFLWYFLSDNEINEVYGLNKWRFIPGSWRKWWQQYFPVDERLLPISYFNEISSDLEKFDSYIKSELLSDIAIGCNKYLMPTVLCPWGCSEYLHRVGYMEMDVCIQRFLSNINFQLVNKIEEVSKYFSARDDYIREGKDDYDNILLNPEWGVLPSICLHKSYGAVFFTCRDHTRGTVKKYLHVPRNPFRHNLPSKFGDQLCHAVINPRSISQMKSSKYSNTYQMHEQKGCFHGIDTCSLKSTGDFSYCDPILDENEALSISYRSDIVSLLSDLEMNNTLSKGSSNEMIRRASFMTKNIEPKKFCSGATFVSITDTMKLQQKVNTHNMISVETDSGTIIHTRRNWIQSIIFCQKCNSNGYGAQFPTLLPLISNTHKTQFLWILCRMLISVKELWDIIEEVPKKTLLWHGWILTYISKQCFNENRIQGISTCPFKTVYINSIDKVFTKMSSIGMCLDTVCGLQNMLSHIPNIRVVTQSENLILT